MTNDAVNPEGVSGEQLKEMLLDGLQNHPVRSEELLTRLCENPFPKKSDEMPISDDFRRLMFRYLLFSDRTNQLAHITTVFEKGDDDLVNQARMALSALADKSWYSAILDVWSCGGCELQRHIENAFDLPHQRGRGAFKRALAICLDDAEVEKRQEISNPYMCHPEKLDEALEWSYCRSREMRKCAIDILANYQDSLVEDRAVEIILDRDEEEELMLLWRRDEAESRLISAFFILMMQNPEKCINYLWRELNRHTTSYLSDAKRVVTVVAMLLTCMAAAARYSWLCAAMDSSKLINRCLAYFYVQFEPGDRWVEPLLNALDKEVWFAIRDIILAALKTVKDQRIADVFLERLKHEFIGDIFRFLCDCSPERLTDESILAGLGSTGWKTSDYAIQVLGRRPRDPKWIPVLERICCEGSISMRKNALFEIARYDNEVVFPTLVQALLDESRIVQESVIDILENRDRYPALARMRRKGVDVVYEAKKIQGQLQSIIDWGKSFGRKILGIHTDIVRLTTEGLGRTLMWPGARHAEIEVAFDPITYRHKHGEDIVQALILHEIGHHLYDNLQTRGLKSVMGQVRAEGLDELFSILQDERLERRLRSFLPEFQPHIDRLNSYAFAEQTTDIPLFAYAEAVGVDEASLKKRIASGEMAGVLCAPIAGGGGQMVMLKPVDLMALPGVMVPLQAFLLCLKGGFSPDLYHDRRVADALKLLPSNFKDLNHAGMLKVARSIRYLLDIPEHDRQTKQYAKRDERNGDRGSRGSGLSPQAAQALAGAVQQMMERIRGLHVSMKSMASGVLVPDEFLEAAEKGDLSLSGRSKIKRDQQASDDRQTLPGSKELNLAQHADFDALVIRTQYEFDSKAHADLVIPIRPHIRILRAYFEQLGIRVTEEAGVQQGRRLDADRARMLPLTGNPNVMIRRYDVGMANAYIGILIDKSGSMDGEKMERAKSFATLISESAKGIRGIAGDIGAFDDDAYYHLGDLQHCAIGSLEADDANNDAGGLARAAERALASGKQHKLLIMISDGSPTECSEEALANLVQRLNHEYGIVSVQVAVDRIEHEAFPDFVDLTAYDFHEAVARFGQMVRQHTCHWY